MASSLLTNLSSSESSEPELELDPDQHTVEVAVGETATTKDGSRVTVEAVDAQPADHGTAYTVVVEYCAAEDNELVRPANFRMLHSQYTHLAHSIDPSDDALEVTRLDAGECATGNLGFFIAEEEPTELKVDYRPGDLSSLTWVVDDPE